AGRWIRASNAEAGSSLGSCGIRRPEKASLRSDWRRAAERERPSWHTLSADVAKERASSILLTISSCSIRGGSGIPGQLCSPADASLPAGVLHRHAGVGLFEDRDDLRLGEPRLLHGNLLPGTCQGKLTQRTSRQNGLPTNCREIQMNLATPKGKESAHDRLLNAAAILFYNDGIAATGIDAIVKKAGVAKKSLYNNFAYKAELVAQYLQIRHAEWLSLYEVRVRQAKGPAERVLSVFEAY